MDRTIHFGDDAADARYRIQDTSSTGGDLVLAEDLDGGTVLLEYDYSASEWVSRGPVNLNGNDITNAGSITADALEAKSVIGGPRYAGAFDGSDPDARFDNAITAASDGDTIELDNGTYDANHQWTKRLLLAGQGGNSTFVSGTLTADGRSKINRVGAETIVLNTDASSVTNGNFGTGNIDINASRCHVDGCIGPDGANLVVTFGSGTANGVVDSSVNVAVTDNGSNTVGDIS